MYLLINIEITLLKLLYACYLGARTRRTWARCHQCFGGSRFYIRSPCERGSSFGGIEECVQRYLLCFLSTNVSLSDSFNEWFETEWTTGLNDELAVNERALQLLGSGEGRQLFSQ